MLWLSGTLASGGISTLLDRGVIGLMDAPANRFAFRSMANPRWIWAADNGAFSGSWRPEAWWAWLADARHSRETCLFATLPDVVGDAARTLDLAARWVDAVRGEGYRVAYVAQDGSDEYPPPWSEIDVLFIGGSTDFKLGPVAVRLMAEAHHRGKGVHVGRVNSLRRLDWCREHHATSADGTFLRFAPEVNVPRMLRWLESMAARPTLWTSTERHVDLALPAGRREHSDPAGAAPDALRCDD